MKTELVGSELPEYIKGLIDKRLDDEILALFSEAHPADIAEVMEELSLNEAKYLYLLLDEELASDVLLELPEYDRMRFLKALSPEEIANRFIENMDSDDAADVIGEMDDDLKEAVLQKIEDKEQAGDIADLLEYDEDTAGGLMAKELVKVNENWTVQTCLKEISRQAEEIDEIYFVYIVDNDNILKGILSLSRLIQNPNQTKVKNIKTDDVISVRTDAMQEEVAQIMEKYDLVVLPVVDNMGRLKGRITIDDVVDVIREETGRDYQMVSGITGDLEPGDKVWMQTRARVPWLVIGAFGGLMGARILGFNSATISEIPAMACFIPLIAATAGNVGVQSSSIVVQNIANGARIFDSFWRKMLREFTVGIVTALFFATSIFFYNFFFSDNFRLTLTVSCTLFIVIVFASMFGTVVPLILHRMKIDPALATGPFITTSNDILGLLLYMGVAKFFFHII
jgi:magnesium transporter